jgi:hypothetical protein
MIILEFVGLLFAGILAGVEFIVRYGVQPSLASLDDRAHIVARHALITRLRVLVPALMFPTVGLAVAAAIVLGDRQGVGFRWAAVIALVAYLLFSFLGTVPLNMVVYDWNVDALPADWRSVIRRWEVVDVFRSSAAILAFVLLLAAAVRPQ